MWMGRRHLVVRGGADLQRAHRRRRISPWVGREARLSKRYPWVEVMGESVAELSLDRLGYRESRHWNEVEHVLTSDAGYAWYEGQGR